MKSFCFYFILPVSFIFFAYQLNSQSIGYSFAYTLPYTNNQSQDQHQLINKYSKSSEYSIGLTLSNFTNLIHGLQIRLSKYTATNKREINTITGFVYTESAITKYMVELEGYLLSKKVFNGLTASLGTKYSLLLRSNHESFTESFGQRSDLNDVPFGGPQKFKFEMLLRFNWQNIRLSENLSFTPSYVFGYAFEDDFKADFPNSKSLNNRFELTLVKNIDVK